MQPFGHNINGPKIGDGDSAPFFGERRAGSPSNTKSPGLRHLDLDQTVGRIKMKLGVQVGLGPYHIVLDGDPAPPPQKGAEPPNFWPYIVAKRLQRS